MPDKTEKKSPRKVALEWATVIGTVTIVYGLGLTSGKWMGTRHVVVEQSTAVKETFDVLTSAIRANTGVCGDALDILVKEVQ